MADDDIEAALRTLSARPTPNWAAAAELRRRGTIRRRRHHLLWAGGAGVVTATLVVALTVTLTDGTSSHRAQNKAAAAGATATSLHITDRSGTAVELMAGGQATAPPSDPAEAAVARADAELAITLLRRLQADPAANLIVSPASLAQALAMLNYGARGQTQRQIADLLAPSGTNAADIASGWSTLVADWARAAAADKVTLSSANNVWLQRGAPIGASFAKALASYFDSGVWQADFAADPQRAADDLNAWVSRQTHGKIPQLVTKDDVAGLLLVLVNALYFDAPWTEPFGPASPIAFHTAAGSTKSVPAVMRVSNSAVLSTAAIDAVQLTYGPSGRFAALLIEPKQQSLWQYVDTLGPGAITAVADRLQTDQGTITMPTVSLNSDLTLTSTLRRLGVVDAFDPAKADLTGISPDAANLAWVIQKATLDVTSAGTTATAATGGGLLGASSPISHYSITFNRPYLFVLRDTKTGAVLFTAEINDPTAH